MEAIEMLLLGLLALTLVTSCGALGMVTMASLKASATATLVSKDGANDDFPGDTLGGGGQSAAPTNPATPTA